MAYIYLYYIYTILQNKGRRWLGAPPPPTYEQFSRNGFAMAPERMLEKISDFKIMNISYIILKHVVQRFRIYKYIRKILKFRENMSKNRFREISLSVHKIAKFEYFAKVIIYSKSPDHVL